jgi:hypothetical protein
VHGFRQKEPDPEIATQLFGQAQPELAVHVSYSCPEPPQLPPPLELLDELPEPLDELLPDEDLLEDVPPEELLDPPPEPPPEPLPPEPPPDPPITVVPLPLEEEEDEETDVWQWPLTSQTTLPQ